MPPKKLAKPNAFVIFSQELMNQPGRKYASLKEAIDAAGPLWEKMSKDQKKTYEDRAKALRQGESKLTWDGRSVEELTREQRLKQEAETNARQEIRTLITLAQNRKVLDTETFFLVHCNIFCYFEKEDRYWPAEIGVVAFNLRDGVKPENIYHSMVLPGSLPIGYKFEAMQHSNNTHLIDIPNADENNMESVYEELKEFIARRKPAGCKNMPILYTYNKFAQNKYPKVVENILNTWAADYDDSPGIFRVYELQAMLYYLRNIVAGDQVWSSFTFSCRELEKDVYDYQSELACFMHANSSRPLYCSRSIALRFAYIICDNCCSDLKIDLIEGRHVPEGSKTPDNDSSSSSFSSRSLCSSRSSKKGYDNEYEGDASGARWETESISSNASTTRSSSNFEDNFPTLGQRRPRSQASSYSTETTSNSTVQSYVGAVSSGLPTAFERSLADLSLRQRGTQSLTTDSDSESVRGAGSVSSLDLPALGRGRGFRRPLPRKPGPDGDKA